MRNGITKLTFLVFFSILAFDASAQTSTGGGSNYFIYALIALAVLILLAVIIQLSDSLLRVEAKEIGADKSGTNYSIFPTKSELFGTKLPDNLAGQSVKVLKKGFDIKLEGEANKLIENGQVKTFAIQPTNFIGISPIPKVTVEVGDEIKAGDAIFFDKKRPEVKYAAPVSGEVIAINRGEKRSIASVVILADNEIKYRAYDDFNLETGSRKDLVNYLLDSGVWPMINQRPFDVVADPAEAPKNIFISTFDSAPLAPDNSFIVNGQATNFQKGLDVLGKLTEGKVFLGLDARAEEVSEVFTNAEGVEKTWFQGAHPSGNVGIQIHHTAPIGTKDKVWTLGVQDVITLGALFTEKRFNAQRVIALTGAELKEPKYIKTYQGANIGDLINANLAGDHFRAVSGDVLSGTQVATDGFVNYRDDQVTILKEGDEYELFGWLLPLKGRPSVSKTFPNFLFPDIKFEANTNTHGEKRAFVVTGQYEKVLPMDVYPQHLMKAIIVNDFEKMEGLGIYELSPEDLALCEFVCTSKQPLQSILREGLETMREQS